MRADPGSVVLFWKPSITLYASKMGSICENLHFLKKTTWWQNTTLAERSSGTKMQRKAAQE